MANLFRLNVGSGMGWIDGWVNCDLYPGPHVDEVFDCQGKWPFPDNSVQDITSSHMLEHLSDPKAFFREAWRVLIPNGAVALRVPYGGHRAAWYDLEHKRPWFAESFAFVQPGYAKSVGNPQHDGWEWPFAVDCCDYRLGFRVAPYFRRRWLRALFLPWVSCVPDWCEELYVYLSALKTPDAVDTWCRSHSPNLIPSRYVVLRHHLEGKRPKPGDTSELIPIAELDSINGYI